MEYGKIQWHPAFDAALQITLQEDADDLMFEVEHLLGKKPLQVDGVIIKRDPVKKVKKQIGHLFRKYNLIEYKSPDDYLSINDFYKTYAYACLYQSGTKRVKEILPEEITITFVCSHYPREMIRHMQEDRGIKSVQYAPGIYHLKGDVFPMQLVLTDKLLPEEYFWLYYLRNNIVSKRDMEKIAKAYQPYKNSELHQAVMDAIVRGNIKDAEVEQDMCEALYELFADELAEREGLGRQEGRREGRKEGRREGFRTGKIQSIFDLLEDVGVIPEKIRQRILEEKDTETLSRWLKMAAKISCMEEFRLN